MIARWPTWSSPPIAFARARDGVAADATAYEDVVQARRAGVSAPIQAALVRATDAPLAVARLSGETLALAAELAPRARPATLSDLAEITDRAYVAAVDDEVRRLTADADTHRRRVLERERG